MKKYIFALLFGFSIAGGAAVAIAGSGDPEQCTRNCMEARRVCIAEGGGTSYCNDYYRRCLAGCGGLN